VATDGGVGASEVAWFPGLVGRAEGVSNVLWELRASGGVDGLWTRETLESSEPVEGLDDFLGLGQNRDRVRLEAGAGSLTGFELAIKDNGGVGKFLFWQAQLCAKEDLGWPAPGQSHQAHSFFEVAVAGQKLERFLDEGLRIQTDQVGLVPVDLLVVGGVNGAGFFGLERKIAEALAGAHLSWTQDQVIGLPGADRVAVLGEVELNGSRGVIGFQMPDFGLADSAQFLERQSASAAVGR
jgi:hypothetical protein